MNAQFLEARVEHRVRSDNADVGGQRKIHARADGRTVDGGDGR